jgi:hypothetical protein
MTRIGDRPGAGEATRATAGTAVCRQSTHAVDTFAWCGVFISDGRVVSIAWLRGWPGAVSARWSR